MRSIGMVLALCASSLAHAETQATAVSATPATARANRRHDVGLILTLGGGVFAVAGAAIMGRGFTSDSPGTCAGYPMSASVCSGEALELKAAGGAVLGISVGVSIAGGILLGIANR